MHNIWSSNPCNSTDTHLESQGQGQGQEGHKFIITQKGLNHGARHNRFNSSYKGNMFLFHSVAMAILLLCKCCTLTDGQADRQKRSEPCLSHSVYRPHEKGVYCSEISIWITVNDKWELYMWIPPLWIQNCRKTCEQYYKCLMKIQFYYFITIYYFWTFTHVYCETTNFHTKRLGIKMSIPYLKINIPNCYEKV